MKIRLLFIFLFCLCSLLRAQDNLPTDTFEIIKEYQPTLVDAKKIEDEVDIVDTAKVEVELDYEFSNEKVNIEFIPDPIVPAKIKGEPMVRLYNGYTRVGIGNGLVPFAELYYNNLRSKKYSIGTHLKYLNMPDFNDIEGSGMDKSHIEVFGKRFWKSKTLDTRLSFDRHNFNYYGYYNVPKITTQEVDSPDLEQFYNRFSAEVGLSNNIQDSFNLRYDGQAKYYFTSNKASQQENNILIEGTLSQFRNADLYQLDLGFDFNSYDNLQESSILKLSPHVKSVGKKFSVEVGLGIFMNSYKGEDADFHFFPIAEANYFGIKDVFIPYVGLTGGIIRNSYRSFTMENPFVNGNIDLLNSNLNYNLFGGLRGSFNTKLSYNVKLAYLNTENSPLYVKVPDSDLLISKDFFVVYDEIKETQVRAEITFKNSDRLNTYFVGEYFKFDTKEQKEAWHSPELKISARAEYNLYHKIIVKAAVFYWGSQYAQNLELVSSTPIVQTDFTIEKLDPIIDINLGIEYRYTKRLSAFLDLNNLGGINYEKYQDYPVQGFNVWGGFTYSF